ncbi:MAG: SusC/RagA family TonB-linked outer membrane protein [Chitinophagaceae bacterium]
MGLLNPRVKLPSNTPLIVVDGVPLPSMANIITQLPSPAGNPDISSATIGGLSQLRFINMDDIETVVVLKDADATAIYGSRGANGVILIETRKARAGTPNLTVDLRQGIARAPSYIKLMNASQYIAMRKEAFGNDKLTITEANAPDLAAWNSNNDKDYSKLLMGNTAAITNVHTSIAGWSELASYHLDLGYYRQGTVFPGKTVDKNFYDRDIFLHGNISLQSKNKKLSSSFTGLHTSGRTNSIGIETFLQGRLLAPNAPDLLDTNNKLTWPSNLFNPYSYLLQGYQADIENTLGNFKVNYKPGKDFTIKGNFGLNLLNVDEHNIIPIAAKNPATQPTGTTITASNFIKTYVFELTAEKTFHFKQWNFMLLGGGTINRQSAISDKTTNSGFSSDALLDIPSAAAETKTTSNNTEYKYAGALGALHVELKDRYILNLTGRRDGSSRYGAGNRYGNFGAAGFTWILSRENFLSSLSWLQLAKLRASYGITGNDQIGDYMYIDAWNQVSSPRNYGGITGFTPTSHYNENYQWELCRKFEVAAELAFDHQWSFIFSYYNNLSSNQLITQNVTSQTGFGSIAARNADVKVVNRGFEYYFEKQSSQRGKYHWTIALIGTIPINKLISFPGLNESLYANQLVEGRSITVRKGYIFKGLNQQTGLYEVVDRDNNGLYNTSDYVPFGDKDPNWFGGLRGSLTLKNFMLDFGWEFCIQKGENQLLTYLPGRLNTDGYSNLPVEFLDRWRQPGDAATFQKLTTSTSSEATKAWSRTATSNLSLTNASYLRLKNICLSYTFKSASSANKEFLQYKIYLLAENAVTITKYKGADPATLNPSGLPILKRFSAGIQISFK